MIEMKEYLQVLGKIGDFTEKAEMVGEDGDKVIMVLRKKLKNLDEYHDENARGAAVIKAAVADRYKMMPRPTVLNMLDAINLISRLAENDQHSAVTDALNSLELQRYLSATETGRGLAETKTSEMV